MIILNLSNKTRCESELFERWMIILNLLINIKDWSELQKKNWFFGLNVICYTCTKCQELELKWFV